MKLKSEKDDIGVKTINVTKAVNDRLKKFKQHHDLRSANDAVLMLLEQAEN